MVRGDRASVLIAAVARALALASAAAVVLDRAFAPIPAPAFATAVHAGSTVATRAAVAVAGRPRAAVVVYAADPGRPRTIACAVTFAAAVAAGSVGSVDATTCLFTGR